MARLTSNQTTAIQGIVEGDVPGYLRGKTMDSLIKRGLVVRKIVVVPGPRYDYPPRSTPLGHVHVNTDTTRHEYRLTPAGHEEYVEMRTSWYKDQLATVEEDFRLDLWRARGSTDGLG